MDSNFIRGVMLKKTRYYFLFLMVLVCVILTSCDFINSSENDPWTIMVYMAGDNSLSEYVPLDINEMEQGLYNSRYGGNFFVNKDINILVLADQIKSNDSKLYLIKPDSDDDDINSKQIIDDSYTKSLELDMSDPDTLEEFVYYAMDNYAADNYALIIWNHGGGAKGTSNSSIATTREVCEDDSAGGTYLYTNQIQQALNDVLTEDSDNPPLDIIGFDACYMGTIEEAYEYRSLSKYFVGSMASEWGYGWDYESIFENFEDDSDYPTSTELADLFVTQYYSSTKDNSSHNFVHAMTAVDTTKLDAVKNNIDNLAALIYNNGSSEYEEEFESIRAETVYPPIYNTTQAYLIYYPYYDLYDFLTRIAASSVFSSDIISTASSALSSFSDSVISCYGNSVNLDDYSIYNLGYNYYETADSDAVRGLTILIPAGEQTYMSKSFYDYCDWYTISEITGEEYGGLDFCTYDDDSTVETWRELFEAWYAGDEAEY